MKSLENSKKYFEDYFSSIFAKSNLLTPKEYENTFNSYNTYFGNFLPRDKNVRIIDIGCGTGHFLYYLKKMGYRNFTGIDLSSDNIEFCKKKITPNVELADGFEYLVQKEGFYSVISANHLLEHIPKEKVITFLRLIYNALRSDGILLITIPNMSNIFSIQMRYRDFTHECGFTEKSIYQVLYMAGFRDILISSSWSEKKSIKSYIRKILLKKLFWFLGGYNAPEILSTLLIVIAKK
jgi:2-polyprenyl-3-methyl-5-hydroxy-6-metoxy-1,4-benzoquinol methylase